MPTATVTTKERRAAPTLSLETTSQTGEEAAAAISVSGLVKRFGATRALDGLDLTVAVGRTLLLVAHDRSNLEHGHGGPQHPTVLYTADDVAGDLTGTGLEIERAEIVERPVETPDGERIALDLLVRARRRLSEQRRGVTQGA
jgi:hypothetical protein